jgi:hypothetical protein
MRWRFACVCFLSLRPKARFSKFVVQCHEILALLDQGILVLAVGVADGNRSSTVGSDVDADFRRPQQGVDAAVVLRIFSYLLGELRNAGFGDFTGERID